MSVYFWSDIHLGHKNIIDYCDRPFRTADGQPDIDAMSIGLAAAWDSVVRPEDTIYVLGDLGFKPKLIEPWIAARPGTKIWVPGNHDPQRGHAREAIARHFVRTDDLIETKVEGQMIVLCHYPLLRWNGASFRSWMLHGHTHGDLKYPYPMRIQDVGVDVFPRPVSFDELKLRMDSLPIIPHHYHPGET
jgi:calcineurin-like phosphoesterase family protein